MNRIFIKKHMNSIFSSITNDSIKCPLKNPLHTQETEKIFSYCFKCKKFFCAMCGYAHFFSNEIKHESSDFIDINRLNDLINKNKQNYEKIKLKNSQKDSIKIKLKNIVKNLDNVSKIYQTEVSKILYLNEKITKNINDNFLNEINENNENDNNNNNNENDILNKIDNEKSTNFKFYKSILLNNFLNNNNNNNNKNLELEENKKKILEETEKINQLIENFYKNSYIINNIQNTFNQFQTFFNELGKIHKFKIIANEETKNYFIGNKIQRENNEKKITKNEKNENKKENNENSEYLNSIIENKNFTFEQPQNSISQSPIPTSERIKQNSKNLFQPLLYLYVPITIENSQHIIIYNIKLKKIEIEKIFEINQRTKILFNNNEYLTFNNILFITGGIDDNNNQINRNFIIQYCPDRHPIITIHEGKNCYLIEQIIR